MNFHFQLNLFSLPVSFGRVPFRFFQRALRGNFDESAGNLGNFGFRGPPKISHKPPNTRGTAGNLETSGEIPGRFWGSRAMFLQISMKHPDFTKSTKFRAERGSCVFFFCVFLRHFVFFCFCAGQCVCCVWAFDLVASSAWHWNTEVVDATARVPNQ